MIGPLILLPHEGARHLLASPGTRGTIRFRRAPRDNLTVISFVHNGTSGFQTNLRPRRHPLNNADPGGEGLWCTVPVDLPLLPTVMV